MLNQKCRGSLIVLEGIDRCGKSTQCKMLVEMLQKISTPAKLLAFPDRTSPVGAVIKDYLERKVDLTDKAVHLLFAANRWEKEPFIRSTLNEGITLIVDRYSYSGVAFSAAKHGMERDWCWQAERGLPKPDLVLFLEMSADLACTRNGYGNERFETLNFQEKVRANFQLLYDKNSWKTVQVAGKDVNHVNEELFCHVKDVLNYSGSEIKTF